jgi:hypothetical protein
MVSAVSSSFNVENYVSSVVLSSDNLSPSVNFSIQITATLKGNDNNLFPGTCSLTLTESTSSLFGTLLTKSITGGTGVFDVYFVGTGDKRVETSCSNTGLNQPAQTAYLDFTVLANTLKITSVVPSVRKI